MLQDFIEILILSAVQGISEFLPISSSAHLILISNFYDFSSSSLFIDIGLHLGSLFAIIYYFKKDLLNLRNNQKLLVLILVGSIPLIIFGYIIYSVEIINLLRNIEIIAWTTLFFGLVLFLSDKRDTYQNISTNLDIKSILFIGLFQILALIPGVSRAGITLTAARFLKFNRVDSSKIAFLLSIPALAGASFLGLRDAVQQSNELNHLSADRIWMELRTALSSPKSANFFSSLVSLGLTDPWFSKISSFDVDESNSPQLKWVELELQNNFSLHESLELPREFIDLTNLSFQLASVDIEENQENLIDKLEKINFHRNQKEVEEIIKLKFFENKRDYLIKLKDNILSKDFSILGEAPKEDMMKMKKDLYIESIKESK